MLSIFVLSTFDISSYINESDSGYYSYVDVMFLYIIYLNYNLKHYYNKYYIY